MQQCGGDGGAECCWRWEYRGGPPPPTKPPGYLSTRVNLPSHGPGRGQEGFWARRGVGGAVSELPHPTRGAPDIEPAWAGLARGDGPGRPRWGASLPGGCGPGPRPRLPEGVGGTVGAAEGRGRPSRVPRCRVGTLRGGGRGRDLSVKPLPV